MAGSPLSQLSKSELEFLRRAIQRRQLATPITEVALQSVGKGKLFARLGPLAEAPEAAALALIDFALADSPGGDPAPVANASLVWTGPEVPLNKTRPTTAVLLELLGAAQERVVIAGYEFDHGAVIFEPLHRAMVERKVAVSIYLDVRPAPSPKSKMDSYLALAAQRFLQRNWPFGSPLPELYYFPAGAEHGSYRSLHAKCVVVDGEHVLIGSANFTKRGCSRNLEVGVRLQDAALGAALTSQLSRLVEQGELARLHAGATVNVDIDNIEDEDEAEQHARLAEELLVSDEAKQLFVRTLSAGLPAPRVGEDVIGDGGDVIGSPELSWVFQRVAVLLPEQEGSRRALEGAGWTCFAVDLGDDELDALCELVRREA